MHPLSKESQPSVRRTQLVCELFVRGLGLTYAIAFASLGGQITRLIGARGIEPASELLAQVKASSDGLTVVDFPTWLWLTGASDSALRAFCIVGVVGSLFAVAGQVPRIGLFAAWL